jgi:acyl carrier protein
MRLEKFIEDFEDAVEDVEPGSLNAETVFKGLRSWDSLAILTVTDVVEMEYGVLLNKKSFEGVTTIEELYQLVVPKR